MSSVTVQLTTRRRTLRDVCSSGDSDTMGNDCTFETLCKHFVIRDARARKTAQIRVCPKQREAEASRGLFSASKRITAICRGEQHRQTKADSGRIRAMQKQFRNTNSTAV